MEKINQKDPCPMLYACRVKETVVLVQGSYKSFKGKPYIAEYICCFLISRYMYCFAIVSLTGLEHASNIVVVNVWCISETSERALIVTSCLLCNKEKQSWG